VSVKSTRRITRSRALKILREELEYLPNDTLARLMDTLADSRQSRIVSSFDNFIVSGLIGEEESGDLSEEDW
jgi:hypothetical protein